MPCRGGGTFGIVVFSHGVFMCVLVCGMVNKKSCGRCCWKKSTENHRDVYFSIHQNVYKYKKQTSQPNTCFLLCVHVSDIFFCLCEILLRVWREKTW